MTKKGDEDKEDDYDEDKAKNNNQLGVASFFIAKRAAVKLKSFWRKYQDQKAEEETAKKQLNEEELKAHKKQ